MRARTPGRGQDLKGKRSSVTKMAGLFREEQLGEDQLSPWAGESVGVGHAS